MTISPPERGKTAKAQVDRVKKKLFQKKLNIFFVPLNLCQKIFLSLYV